MTDRSGDPWVGATYNGFSAPAPEDDRQPPRRFGSRRLIGAGIATAVILGGLAGVLTLREMGSEPGLPDPPLATDTATSGMPIEVAAPTPTVPPPTASSPLEVLPPDMAEAAAARLAVRAPTLPPMIRPSPVAAQVAETAVPPPAVPASARAPDLSAQPEPGFDCRYAGSTSERMVCGDGELARLDRRLNGAFEEAVASGVPARALRQDQDDWLRIREDAARRAGPDAVASVYRQRIAELRDLARQASEPY